MLVLYVATGDETGPGKVYQVDENGRVLGWVNTPFTPTGMALHRTHGLVLAMPRDGGHLMRIDETGKLSTVLEKDETLVHPVDVGIAGESDTVVVADNIGDMLAATSVGGVKPKLYKRFEGQKWSAQMMSVAVGRDKAVLFGTDGDSGIFRLSGDASNLTPVLPGKGGVAADPKSLLWAATQDPNQIYVFEGQELVKKLRLPPNKSLYAQGLLSFAPTGNIVVAARDSDSTDSGVWFIEYRVKGEDDCDKKDAESPGAQGGEACAADKVLSYVKAWSAQEPKIRSLFPWEKERMTDFVVGPRMLWDRRSPKTYKSIY